MRYRNIGEVVISQPFAEIYAEGILPTMSPIAAMPSLHVAIPAYCAFVGAWIGGWRVGLPLWLYTALATAASVYLGEHYGVDALAGIGLAGGCFWYWGRRCEMAMGSPYPLAGGLLAGATGLSVWTLAMIRSL